MVADEHTDDEVVAWLEGLRAAAAASMPCPPPRTLAYGPHPEQVVDLWGDPESPVLVFSVHGGYFMAMYDRSLNEPLTRALVAAGACVANVEYRRTGSASHPLDSVDDLWAAIDAVVGERSSPPARVVVVGHSAGGYLALAVAGHPEVTEVVAMAPVTDPRRCRDEGLDDGAIEPWVGTSPERDPMRWVQVRERAEWWRVPPTAPVAHIHIVHGDADLLVPLQHSHDFIRRIPEGHPEAVVEVLADTGHFEFLDPATDAVDRVVVAALSGRPIA